MNARQKAKKFKKELDAIKNEPLRTIKVYNTNTKTYYVRQTVDTGYLNELSADAESPQMYIYRELVRQLSEKISDDVEFRLEPSRIPYHTDIIAEIKVITKRR